MAKCRNCKTKYEGLGYICPECGFDNETAAERNLPGCISTALGYLSFGVFVLSVVVGSILWFIRMNG